ncbi:hypothetical protein [uncultured Slackia sp.]|uniref:hypothetical protein n=1 Tax=uncultured Slackia sp. TaxID=665903 RepID=UPI002586B2CA|nr:hypothetical protein [uncultured Slackia sp.]
MEGASDEQCYLFRRARRPRALDKGLRFAPETGEVERKSLGYEPDELASWIKPLPQPTKCFYESGVTGFHLCRELRAMGVSRVALLTQSDRLPTPQAQPASNLRVDRPRLLLSPTTFCLNPAVYIRSFNQMINMQASQDSMTQAAN